ncbi:MAG: chemotaxis protein CheA [Opitutus sp.]
MSSSFSPELRGELLDDFYAECDELLTAIRQGLTQLEERVGKRESTASFVEALFRHCHTIKGISAIVGLRPAEQLAHVMEDLIRAWSSHPTLLTDDHLDLLVVATQRVEQIITAHRTGQGTPSIDDLVQRIGDVLSASHSTRQAAATTRELPPTSPTSTDSISHAADPSLYVATFSPSPALDQRGINVSAVRERLKAIGEIVSATPVVLGKGSIKFRFVVRLPDGPGDLSAWEADGVLLALPESAATPSLPAAEVEPSSSTATRDGDSTAALSLTPSQIVRVDLARLDELMRITGEMVIHRSRLEDRINQNGAASGLKEISVALGRSLRQMREAISRVRMVPIAEIFSRMPFVVRDLARESDKKVNLTLEGPQTEVDKYLVERLREPLLHLVRNAFAHGIESPGERVAAHKPVEASIVLSARSEGSSVVIQIRDDGRGVDFVAVAARATSLGLEVPGHLDAASVMKILCSPGFSTRDAVDLAAGRGVGMAVVANTVRELGGTLKLDTQVGSGAVFTLRLPLTLSIADAIIVSIGSELCAIPQVAVNEIIQIDAREIRLIQQSPVIPYRGGLLPIVKLRAMFKLPEASPERVTLLVCSTERGATGLVVDGVRGQREIVIRPLSDPLLHVPGISGATELGDGRPLLIIDPIAITQGVVRPPTAEHDLRPSAEKRSA